MFGHAAMATESCREALSPSVCVRAVYDGTDHSSEGNQGWGSCRRNVQR